MEKELRSYLGCGQLANGFARFRCACGAERLVAFSCKGRGVCPSCGGRRMCERAADLVDRVLPRVRHRQWVLSLPFWLRWRCARDHALARAVLAVFLRAVFAFQRQRAERRGARGGRTGSVTVIQRFGGALNLNVHFHSLVPDGVWTEGRGGALCFHLLPAPSAADLEALEELIAARVRSLLIRRGLWEDDEDGGRPTDGEEPPSLGALYDAAVRLRAAGGARGGRSLRRIGARMTLEPGTQLGIERRTRGGFDLHAGVVVRAGDRRRLEHLCRYALRPPLAADRLERDGEDYLLALKTRWSDGTTHLRLSGVELLERLAAQVPRPGTNQILHHGVLAANARWRSRIVPASSGAAGCPRETDERRAEDGAPVATDAPAGSSSARPNHTWAELMRRGLEIDSLECPAGCGGRLRLVALIDSPVVIRRILEHLGLPVEAVRAAPARASPAEPELDWSA